MSHIKLIALTCALNTFLIAGVTLLPRRGSSSQLKVSAATKVCEVWGDPHYLTFSTNKFRFHGVGNYGLVDSPVNKLAVQGFNCPFSPNPKASFLVGVAIKAGSHRITIVGNILKVDGETKSLSGLPLAIDDITVQQCAKKEFNGVCVVLPSGAEVHTSNLPCKHCTATEFAINALISLPSADADSATGLCQGCDNNVEIISQSETLFAASDLATLNQMCGAQVDSPYTSPENACADQGISFDSAKGACKSLLNGRTNSQYFYTECMYDYCVTGDVDVVKTDIAAEILDQEIEDDPAAHVVLSHREENEAISLCLAKAPAPISSVPSASGDPHLTNILGERFDLYKVGVMQFLRVPYESTSERANFTVRAKIDDVSESVTTCQQAMYITSLLFGGAWLGDRSLEVSMQNGEMIVLLEGTRVKPSQRPLTIGNMLQLHMPVENKVSVGFGAASIDISSDIQQAHFFLNMRAISLANLGCKVGGLLGEDDHVVSSTPPSGCAQSLSSAQLTASPPFRRSFASASLTQ